MKTMEQVKMAATLATWREQKKAPNPPEKLLQLRVTEVKIRETATRKDQSGRPTKYLLHLLNKSSQLLGTVGKVTNNKLGSLWLPAPKVATAPANLPKLTLKSRLILVQVGTVSVPTA